MPLWDDVKKNLVEWYSTTSEKTTEIARTSSRRWDKFGISRDIERQFSELGSLVYSGLQENQADILAQEGVTNLVHRIKALEEELQLKTEEIEKLKQEYRQKKDAAATVDDTEMETIITDPVLDSGQPESAILVEPMETKEDKVNDEAPVSPEKQG